MQETHSHIQVRLFLVPYAGNPFSYTSTPIFGTLYAGNPSSYTSTPIFGTPYAGNPFSYTSTPIFGTLGLKVHLTWRWEYTHSFFGRIICEYRFLRRSTISGPVLLLVSPG